MWFLQNYDAAVLRAICCSASYPCLQLLEAKKVGIVAHFYMDPQVQGVLTSAGARWPHIAISDSLVMADKAVRMAEAGCRAIAVLGVDFMSENVRAILDEAGHHGVAVSHQLRGGGGISLLWSMASVLAGHHVVAMTP